MRTEFETIYHQLEDSHWWFVARRDVIAGLLSELPKDAWIVEIGCSGGRLLEDLRTLGFKNFWGIDISKQAVAACASRGVRNVLLADGVYTGLKTAAFDVVIASDVLEHLENEAVALHEWKRILKPGGRLIVFVPAHMFLWSEHDEVNEHKRRYAKKALLQVIENNGLRPEWWSYWNCSLFFPITAVRWAMKLLSLRGGSGQQLKKGFPLADRCLAGRYR